MATASAPSPSPEVNVRGLRKWFGPVEVLRGVDLAVARGQVMAVLGPSGCGKTTLLRVLAGFETADAGVVEVDGEPVRGPSPKRGMVAQAGTLFPWLPLKANLAWGLEAAGASDTEAVIEDLLEVTGLSGFADALPRHLSGGMRQRAAIAQVLATRPPVLLLDEPFGALDAQTRLRMHEWLRRLLAERPTTVVLVTHDVDEALLLGDRLGLLSPRPGQVTQVVDIPLPADRGRATLSDPRFVALKDEVLRRVLDQ